MGSALNSGLKIIKYALYVKKNKPTKKLNKDTTKN